MSKAEVSKLLGEDNIFTIFRKVKEGKITLGEYENYFMDSCNKKIQHIINYPNGYKLIIKDMDKGLNNERLFTLWLNENFGEKVACIKRKIMDISHNYETELIEVTYIEGLYILKRDCGMVTEHWVIDLTKKAEDAFN